MAVQERLYTADDLASMPDDGMNHELIEGVLIQVSRPKHRHGAIAARFAHFLNGFVIPRKIGQVTVESGYQLGQSPDTVVGPDAAFISNERLARQGEAKYPPAPDLALEIVSPNDTADEVDIKVSKYLAAGTRLVWVLYSEGRKVYVYRTPESAQIIDINGTLDGGDVLPGFTLALKDVFEGLGE